MTLADRGDHPLGKAARRTAALFFGAYALWMLQACGHTNEGSIELVGEAQGTTFSILYWPSEETPEADSVAKNVQRLLQTYNEAVSLWDPTSDLSRLNKGESMAQEDLSPLTIQTLAEGERLKNVTQGWMDPSVGKFTRAWGFLQNAPQLGQGFPQKDSLRIDSLWHSPVVVLDVNAFAQGLSVDLVVEQLVRWGVKHALVEIGGEVRALGSKPDGSPFLLGIDAPTKERKATPQKIIPLEDRAMATSGNYRKFTTDPRTGKRYGHTVNPFTGWTATTDLVSVTVLASTASEADGVATACMAMGLQKTKEMLKEHPEWNVYLLFGSEKEGWSEYSTLPTPR